MTDFLLRTFASATVAAAHAPLAVVGIVALVALAGGVAPGVPVDPVLFVVAAVAPEALLLPLVATATVAQMIGRTAVYFGGRRLGGLHAAPRSARVERMCVAFANWPRLQITALMGSALLGVPAFHVTTLVYGALRLPLRTYLTLGAAGRVLRYTAIVLASRLLIP